jgi:multisubunit Na+/H+ antiporter MnhF subunit
MNQWLVAATVLLVALLPCAALCIRGGVLDGLVGLELAGVITTVVLLLIAEGFQRQPFVDLALVFAVLQFGGSLAFARMLERRL